MSVRVFAPAPLEGSAPGERVALDDVESRYLVKVRRVRVGQSVELLDGCGAAWGATVVEARAGRRAQLELAAPRPAPASIPERIVLLGLPDPPAALEALTGASELGATQLVFVRCARSQGHVPSAARIERVWRAAMRQCGRPRPPLVRGWGHDPEGRREPWSLAAALDHRSELPGVFGDPGARATEVPDPDGGLRLLVGPEGGFDATEVQAARQAGFTGLRLGPWILRTPTAVVALLARVAAPGESTM